MDVVNAGGGMNRLGNGDLPLILEVTFRNLRGPELQKRKADIHFPLSLGLCVTEGRMEECFFQGYF